MSNRAAWIVALLMLITVGIYTAVVFPGLPEKLPTHWGISGQPDAWSDKASACMFTLGLMIGLPLLVYGLSKLSPKGFEMAGFGPALNAIVITLMSLGGFIHVVMIEAARNPKLDSGRFILGGVFLFFGILGNFLGKIKKNFWVGVRTPWTLSSDEVWIKTHRLAARLWAAAGFVGAFLAVLGLNPIFLFAMLMVVAMIPVLYSLLTYRKSQGKPIVALLLALVLSGTAAHVDAAEYTKSELSFKGAGGFQLNGTLFMPKVEGFTKVPGVLLLPGSGAPDRDGNVAGMFVSDVYKQMADKLASNGYAVLRFDKRSVGAYRATWPQDLTKINDFFSWDNFMGDAVAGYKFLRQQAGIDTKRMVIAGHSEGGLLVAQMAHDLAKTAIAPQGVMILAGPGRLISTALVEQLELQFSLQIPDQATREKYLDYVRRAIAQIQKDGTLPKDAAPAGLGVLFNPTSLNLMRSYCTIEPTSFCAKYEGDVLVINGELDAQISAERDARRLFDAYQKRSKGTCELVIIPKASHFLKKVEKQTDNPNSGSVLPEALNAMVKWLEAKFKS